MPITITLPANYLARINKQAKWRNWKLAAKTRVVRKKTTSLHLALVLGALHGIK